LREALSRASEHLADIRGYDFNRSDRKAIGNSRIRRRDFLIHRSAKPRIASAHLTIFRFVPISSAGTKPNNNMGSKICVFVMVRHNDCSSFLQTWLLNQRAFIVNQKRSMGFRSGEYGGRYIGCQPRHLVRLRLCHSV